MKAKSIYISLIEWLKTTEMFANPSKQLPGKWKLFEYYTEPDDELLNIKEDELKKDNRFWEIEFRKDEKCTQETNIALPFPTESKPLQWSRAKNFITLIHSEDFRKNTEFQFAIEKDTLKLLKKDAFGKIEFFGFFNRMNSPQKS